MWLGRVFGNVKNKRRYPWKHVLARQSLNIKLVTWLEFAKEPNCFQHLSDRTRSCPGEIIGRKARHEHCPWFLTQSHRSRSKQNRWSMINPALTSMIQKVFLAPLGKRMEVKQIGYCFIALNTTSAANFLSCKIGLENGAEQYVQPSEQQLCTTSSLLVLQPCVRFLDLWTFPCLHSHHGPPFAPHTVSTFT